MKDLNMNPGDIKRCFQCISTCIVKLVKANYIFTMDLIRWKADILLTDITDISLNHYCNVAEVNLKKLSIEELLLI